MCAFCALMAGVSHWSEEGTDAARSGALAGRTRLLDRRRRVELFNRILGFYGCKLSDWNNKSYILRSQRGQTKVFDSLSLVWDSAEKISKKSADPLDPNFLAFLSKGN